MAIEVGDGQSYLVGPDNGLLAPAVAMVGGADEVTAVARALDADRERIDAQDYARCAAAFRARHACSCALS